MQALEFCVLLLYDLVLDNPGGSRFFLRVRAKITSQSSRPDLGQVCSIRDCKARVIAGYFEGFAIEDRTKMA